MGIVDKLRAAKHLRALRASENASEEERAEAKAQLVAFGPGALGVLLESLAHRDLRAGTQEVLERLLNDTSLPKYVEALASQDRGIQDAVAEVLVRGKGYSLTELLAYLENPEIPKARLEGILLERLRELDPRDLLARLPGYSRDARTVVYRLLERTDDPTLASATATLIGHEDWWIRLHAVKLLGKFAKTVSEDALVKALVDSNKSVRLQAVKSLQAIGARSAIPSLVAILRDPDLTVQAAAIDALVGIGDVSAVSHLVEVLKDESEHARRGAVEVLNEVATTEAIQDLIHSLRDADWWVRVRSADALGTIGGPRVVEAILDLVQDDDVHIRRYAIEILNTVPDDRAVEPLVRALHDEDWWVRERSIDALGRTGNERAVQPLGALLREEEQVASLAARALGELGFASAIDELLPLLEGDPEAESTRAAIAALLKIAQGGVPDDVRGRVDKALQQHGVRLEKTKLRPMSVRNLRAPDSLESSAGRGRAGTSEANLREIRPEDIEAGMLLLDRYKVVRKIGSGGFSTVFLVEDKVVGEGMILKILSPHLSVDENMNQRFVQELKIARRISHPNVIRIHDLLQIGKARAISMEYFASSDLSEILELEGRVQPTRALGLSRQICEGLAAAHEAGVIHRDIKPANVLVARDDTVKIVDFGLAAAEREAENRLTRTGHLVGTPHYMAPELIRGEEVGPQADLYSFGILMYEMLTGRLPYDGDNPMNVLFRHLDGNAPPPAQVEPTIPAPLSDVVMRAMAKDPPERAKSARELLAQLEGVRL